MLSPNELERLALTLHHEDAFASVERYWHAAALRDFSRAYELTVNTVDGKACACLQVACRNGVAKNEHGVLTIVGNRINGVDSRRSACAVDFSKLHVDTVAERIFHTLRARDDDTFSDVNVTTG